MITRIVGDIHGKYSDYQMFVNPESQKVQRSIQLGDFGVGFSQGDYWHNRVNDFHSNGNHTFIRGNHDDPVMCKTKMVGYIPDGSTDGNTFHINGAWSIDKAYRTPGRDWWEGEESSYQELDKIVELYKTIKPNVVISHDCPSSAAFEMFLGHGKHQYHTRTADALQAMYEAHQPKFWFFGHWHITKEWDSNGTHFHCLGELDFVDFDFDKLEYVK